MAATPAAMMTKDRDELLLTNFGSSRLLDRDPATEFKALLLKFQQKGGIVAPGITLTFHKESRQWSANAGAVIPLAPGSYILPVCQAGENRSQIARMALLQIDLAFPELHIEVALPHGAEGSVDPFVLPTMTADQVALAVNPDWDREMAYQYYPVMVEPLFAAELGQARVHRQCEAECIRYLESVTNDNEEDEEKPVVGAAILLKRDPAPMRLARDFMNDHYFHKLIIEKRGHVIAFNRAVHVMLLRLLEVAALKNISLEGVVLQPLDSMDPIVMKSVRNFARCFHGLLKPELERKDTDTKPKAEEKKEKKAEDEDKKEKTKTIAPTAAEEQIILDATIARMLAEEDDEYEWQADDGKPGKDNTQISSLPR